MSSFRSITLAVATIAMVAFAPKPASAAFTCNTGAVSTTNPSTSANYTWNLGGILYHGQVLVRSDWGGTVRTNGLLHVEIDKPNELAPSSAWPWNGVARVSGSNLQMIFPVVPGVHDGAEYIEVTTSFTGPYNGGQISLTGTGYDGYHNFNGTFSASGNTSSFYQQTITGAGIPCPASSPVTLAANFNYGIGTPNGWFTGTVVSFQQNSGSTRAYVGLTLSDPNDMSGGAWNGHATCVLDTDGQLDCVVPTNQNTSSGDVGDPIWTFKRVVSPQYYYTYCKNWYCENDGYAIDFWNF